MSTIARLRPKRVFVMGEVNSPGGYTVSSYATVFNVLYSIGGPTINGSLRDVRVLRNGKVIADVDMYAYLAGENETNDLRVQDNDIVYIPPRGKTVAIAKEVRTPAVYELLPGEGLCRSSFTLPGGVLSTAYIERAQIDRIVPFKDRKPGQEERQVLDVDLRKVINEGKDFELYDQDLITVFSILEMRKNVVAVSGAVRRPGRFEIEKVKTVQWSDRRSGGARSEGLQRRGAASSASTRTTSRSGSCMSRSAIFLNREFPMSRLSRGIRCWYFRRRTRK